MFNGRVKSVDLRVTVTIALPPLLPAARRFSSGPRLGEVSVVYGAQDRSRDRLAVPRTTSSWAVSNAADLPSIQYDHPAFFSEKRPPASVTTLVAHLTLVTILAKYVQLDFFRHVDVGHGDDADRWSTNGSCSTNPVLAGDRVVSSDGRPFVGQRFGADVVVPEPLHQRRR